MRAEITLRFESAEKATTVAADITKRAAGDSSPIGALLKGVRASARGSDLVINIDLDKATTEQLIAFLAPGH